MNPQDPWAPPGAPYAQGGGWPPAEYEFDARENEVVGSAASWARVLAVVLFVNAALSLFNCNPFSATLNAVVGSYFLGGAKSLTAVVTTEGNDVANMMQALTKLGAAFKVRVIVTVVALVLILALFFFVAYAVYTLASHTVH